MVSDDEDDINKDEEKFEKDSGVEGEAIEGATRTKEDEDENEETSEKKEQASSNANEQTGDDNDGTMEENEDDGDINDDTETQYEDNCGVDVRDDEKEAVDEPNSDEEQMQLDDGPARELALDLGNTVTTLTPEQVEAWRTAAAPTVDAWIEGVSGQGLDGAALIEEAKALIASYSE